MPIFLNEFFSQFLGARRLFKPFRWVNNPQEQQGPLIVVPAPQGYKQFRKGQVWPSI